MNRENTLRAKKHRVLVELLTTFVPHIEFIIEEEEIIEKTIPHIKNIGAYTVFQRNKPVRIVLSNTLLDSKYSISYFKAIVLHEIGHCLFQMKTLQEDELVAEEFAYFYAYIHKDRKLYNALVERQKLFDTTEEPFKGLYNDVKNIGKRYAW